MRPYVGDEQPQCPACGLVTHDQLAGGFYLCACKQEFEWPYPPTPLEKAEARVVQLEQALRRIRDVASYPPSRPGGAREPRFVMNWRELSDILNEALGAEA